MNIVYERDTHTHTHAPSSRRRGDKNNPRIKRRVFICILQDFRRGSKPGVPQARTIRTGEHVARRPTCTTGQTEYPEGDSHTTRAHQDARKMATMSVFLGVFLMRVASTRLTRFAAGCTSRPSPPTRARPADVHGPCATMDALPRPPPQSRAPPRPRAPGSARASASPESATATCAETETTIKRKGAGVAFSTRASFASFLSQESFATCVTLTSGLHATHLPYGSRTANREESRGGTGPTHRRRT